MLPCYLSGARKIHRETQRSFHKDREEETGTEKAFVVVRRGNI